MAKKTSTEKKSSEKKDGGKKAPAKSEDADAAQSKVILSAMSECQKDQAQCQFTGANRQKSSHMIYWHTPKPTITPGVFVQ